MSPFFLHHRHQYVYEVLPPLIAQGPPLWLGVGNYLKMYDVVLLYIGNPLSLVVYKSLHILATLSSLLLYHWLVYIHMCPYTCITRSILEPELHLLHHYVPTSYQTPISTVTSLVSFKAIVLY